MPFKITKPRAMWIAAAAFFGFVGLCFLVDIFRSGVSAEPLPPARDSAKQLPFMYEPGLFYGDPKSKRLIAFYWSASQQASIDAFGKYLEPLIRKLLKNPSSTYSVLVYQVLENDKRDALGPGGLMLCPETKRQYEWMAVEYLRGAKDVGKREPLKAVNRDVHYINASLRQLAQKYNIDFVTCVLDGKYNLRWAKSVGLSLANDKKFGQTRYPYFVFDNAVVPPGDPRLTKLQELAAQP
jgi:hypothetical protein